MGGGLKFSNQKPNTQPVSSPNSFAVSIADRKYASGTLMTVAVSLAIGILMSGLIVFQDRSNMKRLMKGEKNRIKKTGLKNQKAKLVFA